MENAVEIKNLVKEFDIYHETASLVGLIFSGGKKTRFSALKGIDLNIEKGTTVGITGPNGSGKTTLLKILSGTLYSTSGDIQLNGKVSSILELGAGFHPELTGRENVYLNALLLGFKKDEIEEKYDSIVKFADIGSFIDTKVKTFSSGMYLRLGFSIAIHADFDILLIDEILAVGDIDFQAKCIQKLKEFQDEGKTIIIVSHNRALLNQISDEIYFMFSGQLAQNIEDNDNDELEETEEQKEKRVEIIQPSFEEENYFDIYSTMKVCREFIDFYDQPQKKILYTSLSFFDPSMFLNKYEYLIMNPVYKKMNLNFNLKNFPFDAILGIDIIPYLDRKNTITFLNDFVSATKNIGIISYISPLIERSKIERLSYSFCSEHFSIKDEVIKKKSELDFQNDEFIINHLKSLGVNYKEFYFISLFEWLLYSVITNLTYDIFLKSVLFRKLNTIVNTIGFSASASSENMYQKIVIFSKNKIDFQPKEQQLDFNLVFEKVFLKLLEISEDELRLKEEKEKLRYILKIENGLKHFLDDIMTEIKRSRNKE